MYQQVKKALVSCHNFENLNDMTRDRLRNFIQIALGVLEWLNILGSKKLKAKIYS